MQPTDTGIHMILDMGNCSIDIRDMKIVEGFVKSICSSYDLNIVGNYSSDQNKILSVCHILENGHLTAHVVNSKVSIDVLIMNSGFGMTKMQHIKQQALDYFAPSLYRASLRPRGNVAGHPGWKCKF